MYLLDRYVLNLMQMHSLSNAQSANIFFSSSLVPIPYINQFTNALEAPCAAAAALQHQQINFKQINETSRISPNWGDLLWSPFGGFIDHLPFRV